MAENKAAMTTPDANGRLPLHTALLEEATHGSITFLLKGNIAALQVADNNGMLPLHLSCRYGSADTVKLLAEAYASGLDIVDGSNNYPLHHACLGSKYEVVQYLLRRGTSLVSERNDDGKLPLHLLCMAEEDNATDDSESESTSYVETIMLLLQACPETVLGFFTLPPHETWLRSGRRWKRGRMS
jgi:ankyrin repeat protein